MVEAGPVKAGPVAAGTGTDGLDAREHTAGERLSRNLETVFSKIERERMRDVPILNSALSVACVGMRPFADGWLSVLVTPWFINLIALPADEASEQAWSRAAAGTKLTRQFPAGAFEFICASEDGIGPYQMCSLFSPVLEFESQEFALATAEASLSALFDAGLDPASGEAAKQAPVPAEQAKQEAQNISRRALIFGTNKSKEATY
jgi:[NiFe] hydrogenase assembly HybE family chaperone